MYNYNLPFLLHVIIESPAFLNFLIFPSGQLGTTTPQAHAVVRQYAALILSSILISVAFVRRPLDETSGHVAGGLALYHIAPSARAFARLRRRAEFGKGLIFSEAGLYFVAHSICFGALAQCCWSFYLQNFLSSH